MAIALLDEGRYTEISSRLRQEDFGPDTNEAGNKTLQRWRRKDQNVTIDFLLPVAPGGDGSRRVQPLEEDFGALTSPGLEVVFAERQTIKLDGRTLSGEKVVRQIPVCGPAAFIILKALAFSDRTEPKDAYDLIYMLRRWPAGIGDLADRIAALAAVHAEAVAKAINALATDFADPDRIGPVRAARFTATSETDIDDEAADAHGFVDDLLREHRRR